MSEYRKSPEAVAALTREQYRITQQSGTERPGTGTLLNNKEPGIHARIVSGEPLFASSDKFELLGAVGRASPSPSSVPTLRN